MAVPLGSVASWLAHYWPLISGLTLAVLAAIAVYRRWKHQRWTAEIVEAHRRGARPVRVFLHDRAHLAWAVTNGHLRAVAEFEGGWMVIENMQLGTGTGGAS